jgi:hypothetical protein
LIAMAERNIAELREDATREAEAAKAARLGA